MRSTAVLACSAILFGTMCSSAPADRGTAAAATPSYASQAGEIPVGVIPAATLADEQRDRRLDLTIEYPTRAGSYPVIVFSTGFGTPSRTYIGLSSYLASHGYVVVKVGHPESKADVTDLAEIWKNQTAADWRNRARDLSFVIDSFTGLQERYPELAGKMDAAKVGVAGHSYGAFATMLLAGAKTFSNGVPAIYADPRVRAAIAISPQGPGELRGLTTESWRDVRIPILYLTGTADRGVTEGEDLDWRRQAFELSPAGDKWFVSLAGAGHLAFTGRVAAPVALQDSVAIAPIDRRDPRDPRPESQPRTGSMQPRRIDTGFYSDRAILNVVRTVTLAFWDAYLKNEPAGREYLSKLGTRGDMTVESK